MSDIFSHKKNLERGKELHTIARSKSHVPMNVLIVDEASTNQSTKPNQPTNYSISQSINRPTNQSVKQVKRQTIDRSVTNHAIIRRSIM